MNTLETLSNEQLICDLLSLRGKERELSLQVLLHLIEVDTRKLYRDYGFSSLFTFATGKLGYSDSGAGRRIGAARAMAEFPELISMFEDGRATVGSISIVSHTLLSATEDSEKKEILEALPKCSRRTLEKIKAQSRPVKVVKEVLKPIAVKRSENEAMTLFGQQANSTPTGERSNNIDLEQKFDVRFSITRRCMNKYSEVKLLSSNKHGRDASMETLFETLLDTYLEKESPKKRAERREKRKLQRQRSKVVNIKVEKTEASRSRYIPQSVKDEVYLRDSGRCAFIGDDQERCTECTKLEFDHIQPFALGGASTANNLRLVCQCHNRLLAERVYGKEHMKKFA